MEFDAIGIPHSTYGNFSVPQTLMGTPKDSETNEEDAIQIGRDGTYEGPRADEFLDEIR